ncbi:MAG: succinate dehydrogenase assembly factor 2 [Gammaproteobacteria bacterium]|nr:succinate dehydrogenase assembly factor 2 [Gammaproteobacteria bacterium]
MSKSHHVEEQIRWRSRRRGMLELDLLLGDFFDAAWHDLSDTEKDTFVRLLDETDADLWSWLSQNAIAEDEAFAAMVSRILDRVQPD